jgi:hypothetical protein
MKKHRSSALRGFAASLAVALLVANVARADITWVLQNSSAVTLTGQIGGFDANNNIDELYNMVPQTDNNITLFPGFTNSLSTYSVGTMTSVGNNFLQSLNFGAEPDPNGINLTNAQTVVQNSGDLLPNPVQFTSPPSNYGTPIQQSIAGNLVPTGGYANNNTDGGKVSISTSYGTFSNGTGDKDPITNLHAAAPMPVDAGGNFNAQTLAITGQFNINLALNLNTTGGQGAFSLNEVGTASPSDNTNPMGIITRGAGGTYVMHVPLPAFNDSGSFGALYYNINLSYNLTATANIAAGDANFDGVVNAQDLALVSSGWLTTNAAKLGTGDVNGDGIVNAQDLALVSSNWLKTTPTVPASVMAPIAGGGTPGDIGGPSAINQSVPEPSTWLLLGLGSVTLLWKRRRLRS